MLLAKTTPRAVRWAADEPIARARNAHYTNRADQLEYALRNGYNSLEGDVRQRDGVLIMAHDHNQTSGMRFNDWLSVAQASQRMVRIDVKDPRVFPAIVEELTQHHVSDDRLTLNVSVVGGWDRLRVPLFQLQAFRAAFPHAYLGMNLPLPFGPVADAVAGVARQLPGRNMVALQSALVSAQSVQRMHDKGFIVGAWNEARLSNPTDVGAATQRLREFGVDGMIDVRRRDDALGVPDPAGRLPGTSI